MKKVALCVSNGAWLHKELLSQTWRLHVLGVLKHVLVKIVELNSCVAAFIYFLLHFVAKKLHISSFSKTQKQSWAVLGGNGKTCLTFLRGTKPFSNLPWVNDI